MAAQSPRSRTGPTRLAVVDIGSNSARVVVVRIGTQGDLRVVAGTRASLRLVRDVDASGRFSEASVLQVLTALRDFRAVALGAGARHILAAATAAMRDALNGPALLQRIRRETGIRIRIIAGEEEALYGFLGSVSGLPVAHGLAFDLGGGSMQISRFQARRLLSSRSLPLGSLRLSDHFLKTDPPTPREIRKLTDHVQGELRQARVPALEAGDVLVGTGGTIRNLAKIDRRARSYPIPRLHGYTISRHSVREITALLASRRARKRDRVSGLSHDRSDSIVGGALAVLALMEHVGAKAVRVSGRGVREGMALATFSRTLPEPPAVRAASIATLTAAFTGWDSSRAARRREIAGTLLATLEPRAGGEIRETLDQAATVLDIGSSIDFFERHDHVADIVVATDLEGFEHRQIALLSALVRRAGDEDAALAAYAPLLGPEDEMPLERAALVLAVADDIEERCPPQGPARVRCSLHPGELRVTVDGLLGWRARGLDARFGKAFGRALVVRAGKRPARSRAVRPPR
jgi:exopolyphosphatase/guanosine-5'-triphosphate,3'-diphosphate pyrophosphatase